MNDNSEIKKFFKNFLIGFLTQFTILILGLTVPRIILTNYGSDTNGLLNTISQIFTYMALLEAGISQATTNALYKPLKDSNVNEINEIYFSSRNRFRKTSIIYASVVIVLSCTLPLFLKTNVSHITVALVVLFEGFTNVVSFYFINTWVCVLNSSGKNYIVSSFNLITRVMCYAIKIVLALVGVNIAIIQLGYFIVSLVKTLIFYLYFKKHYPYIHREANKEYTIVPETKHYFVTEVSSVIFSSTDMIVLSLCVSTAASSVYSVYNLVFVSLSTLLNSVFVSIVYVLNQTYITNIYKYKIIHDAFNSFFVGCATIMMCVSYFLIIPFVRLYTKDIVDANYINQFYPVLFCLIQLLSWFRYVPNNLAGISGNAKKNAIYSVIEAVCNICLSFALVFSLDICGVLLATVISLPIRVFLLNYLSEKRILNRSPLKTILILLTNLLIFGASTLVSFFLGEIIVENWGYFILFGLILISIYVPIVFFLNYLVNKDFLNVVKMFFKKRKQV